MRRKACQMQVFSLTLIIALTCGKAAHAGAPSPGDQAIGQERCYGHLTELVRSSNFPLDRTQTNKANLIIDSDTGHSVLAKLFFDTQGTGTLGWIEYRVDERKLLNVSAYLEEPELLAFDEAHAENYAACIDSQGS